ncbi:FXYD domain-containing ion transport regulator 3 isoform X1 [Phascolarctos cinereus]|uniref:FXYD domain-containing ion transport regulator n=2 Tax=Phascolarctos cinereus TaxID=38626 RepID=A0A6P5JH49_PHACI|nr:FXYD domain-containing ion transport regulator 3 isoform X1 [Phascolarctos cinereus]
MALGSFPFPLLGGPNLLNFKMHRVTVGILLMMAVLPALEANDPADKNSPFYYDWHSLRVGGLICAGILCAVGIIVLMSGKCKCKFSQKHTPSQ